VQSLHQDDALGGRLLPGATNENRAFGSTNFRMNHADAMRSIPGLTRVIHVLPRYFPAAGAR